MVPMIRTICVYTRSPYFEERKTPSRYRKRQHNMTINAHKKVSLYFSSAELSCYIFQPVLTRSHCIEYYLQMKILTVSRKSRILKKNSWLTVRYCTVEVLSTALSPLQRLLLVNTNGSGSAGERNCGSEGTALIFPPPSLRAFFPQACESRRDCRRPLWRREYRQCIWPAIIKGNHGAKLSVCVFI